MVYKILNWFRNLFKKAPARVPLEPVVAEPIPTPVVGSAISLFIPLKLYGLDYSNRRSKFMQAIGYAEAALQSKEFKDWFMSYKFTQLGDYEDHSNEFLYARLLKPVKFNYGVVSGTIFNRNVVGYNEDDEYTEGADVFTYENWYDSFEIPDLGDHLTHEVLCHGNNFSHAYRWTPERDKSVPYAVGYYISGKR